MGPSWPGTICIRGGCTRLGGGGGGGCMVPGGRSNKFSMAGFAKGGAGVNGGGCG